MEEQPVFEADELKQVGIAISPPATIQRPRKRTNPALNKGAKKVKQMDRKDANKTVRFSSAMDLELLQEIGVSKPFPGKYKEVPKKWEELAINLNWPDVNVKTIRRRFDLLYKKFLSDELASLNSSGTEEDFDEKQRILTDIKELISSSENVAGEDEGLIGESIRTAALNGMVKTSPDEDEKEQEIKRRKKAGVDLALVIQEKNKQKFELNNNELQFKREKFLKLLEQQELDREQREADRRLELRRIEATEKANQNQHQLMMKLLEKLTK